MVLRKPSQSQMFQSTTTVILLLLSLLFRSHANNNFRARYGMSSPRRQVHQKLLFNIRSKRISSKHESLNSVSQNNNNDGLEETPSPTTSNESTKSQKKSPGAVLFSSQSADNFIDPKRFLLFNLLAITLAIGANFLGGTSVLLSSTFPEYFQQHQFDQIYPINGYKRHVDTQDHYEFRIPENWLIDRSVVLAEARERELPQNIRERSRNINRRRPDMAYGPMDSDGSENVSIIKTTLQDGFNGLESLLGDPNSAAEKLLGSVIAPAASGKTYKLIDARSTTKSMNLAYVFEYIVRKGEALNQHSVSVIIARGKTLYTLTAVCPDAKWNSQRDVIYNIAESFNLF